MERHANLGFAVPKGGKRSAASNGRFYWKTPAPASPMFRALANLVRGGRVYCYTSTLIASSPRLSSYPSIPIPHHPSQTTNPLLITIHTIHTPSVLFTTALFVFVQHYRSRDFSFFNLERFYKSKLIKTMASIVMYFKMTAGDIVAENVLHLNCDMITSRELLERF